MQSKKTKPRKRSQAIPSYVSALEILENAVADDLPRYGMVLGAAVQLRNLLLKQEHSLSSADKIRILKSVARAKARAYFDDDHRAFMTLENINGDITRLL